MMATLRALLTRIHRLARGHTAAVAVSTLVGVAVAGLGGGFVLASQGSSSSPLALAAATTSGGAAAALPSISASGVRAVAARAARQLVRLVAKQTDQTPKQVGALLRQGETLDQVSGAKAQAVVAAAEAAVKSRLDAAVAAGKITPAQEATRLARFDGLINKAMSLPGPRLLRIAAGVPAKVGNHGTSTPSPSPSAAPATTS